MTSRKLGEQPIQVFVRCRPRNSLEKRSGIKAVDVVPERKEILVNARVPPECSLRKSFTFQDVFGPEAKQIDVFQAVMKPAIAEVMMAYTCTVLAYGHAGTGKTFTMEGERSNDTLNWADDPLAGIIPRTLQQLFEEVTSRDIEFTMKVSYIHLYNEQLFDLLSADEDTTKLKIFDDPSRKGSVIIQGLEEIMVRSREEAFRILQKGNEKRKTTARLQNATSSCCHTIFMVTVHIPETADDGEEIVKVGKINLVDLAGTDNIGRSGAIYRRVRDAGSLNHPLLTLSRVTTALVEKKPHVPYRESKLTRLLQDSLAGRTRTFIIATISPDVTSLEQTLSTLDYAHRARNITTRPEANQKMTKQEYTKKIERLQRNLIAARKKNTVFLDQKNYRMMEQRLTSQSQCIFEKEARIASLNAKLRTVTERFERTKRKEAATTENLQAAAAELHSTKRSLYETEQVLSKTSTEKEQQAHLIQAHCKTEAALTATAQELVAMAETTTTDIELLQQKLERTCAIDQTNKQRQYAFVVSTSAVFDKTESSFAAQLASQRDTLTGIGGSFASLNSLVQQHQAAVAACMLEARMFADESVAVNASILSSLLSKIQASQEQQAAQMAADLANDQARLQELCKCLVVERMQAAQIKLQELEEHQSALAEQLASVCRLISDEVTAHHVQQVRLVTSINEENDKLNRHLLASNEEICRLSAAMEMKRTEAEKNMAAFRQQFENFTQLFFSSQAMNNATIAKINGLSANVVEAISKQTSAIKSNAASLAKYSGDLVSSVATLHQDGAKAASDCFDRAEKASVHVSNIHKVMEKSISDEVASLSESLSEQKRVADDRIAAYARGMLEAVAAGTNTAQGQADRAKALAGDLDTTESQSCGQLLSMFQGGTVQTAKAQEICEALRVCTANDMDKCSSVVSNFILNDLQEFVHTGCTPQREEYQYPTELAQTSPHEQILRRLDTASSLSAATGLALPTPDEANNCTNIVLGLK
ncbi:kinesin-like protein KIF11 isoform X2 [Dermacentor albipictus]|uniref:kinesin-like protein KIF11 isoform X2 n=1 Tax=Dermacentor albipictus TaxID=60249 RepID=UPI0038FC60F3